jgi:hypothetical protein
MSTKMKHKFCSHPIETGRYIISTNEINRICNKVINWIDNRIPGAIIYGEPRLGKTNAINVLKTFLKEYYDNTIPIFIILCPYYRNTTEDTFYTFMLKNVGHPLYLSGVHQTKKDRLIKYILSNRYTENHRKVLFFFDDAQNLSTQHYYWLMDIYNELNSYGILMTTIFVGQVEILHQKISFKKAKQKQIIGRFMVHEHKFRGIVTLNDLKECLKGYDEDCEYPINSNTSFTEHYFPDAYKDNKRLSDISEILYIAFQETRMDYGIKIDNDIPMQYFTLTIEYIFKKYGVNGVGEYWIKKEHCKSAIINSGLIAAEAYGD